ncbi:MAG: cytochrome c3 family protein [Kofleriaceae bacterium]|nr:cytochrome c3 family protein [Kofleriaceae bacterium]
MAALFPRWTNAVYATALVALAVAAAAALTAPMIFVRTPYVTQQGRPVIQPVAFDHRHHVRDDGIDCLYCHPDAERSSSAGLPTTELCMGCHGQVWSESPLLAPVRISWETGASIPWRRVNAVPGFVYFHHGVHVRGGVACARCHGEVENMARVARHAPLTMEWCLDCHRDPPDRPDQGRRITPLTTCSACHR